MEFWTIYFWLIAVLVIGSALGRLDLYFRSEMVNAYDLIESGISVVAIVGLHGYVYRASYLSPVFWKFVWFLLLLTWLASLGSRKNRELVEKIGAKKGIAIIAATSIIGMPTLVGLFIYGFLS